jgi:hypothetical protein
VGLLAFGRARAIVLIAERDAAVVNVEQPLVRDRDPMGLAPDGVEHLWGAGKRSLRVETTTRSAGLVRDARRRRGVGEDGQGSGEAENAGRLQLVE